MNTNTAFFRICRFQAFRDCLTGFLVIGRDDVRYVWYRILYGVLTIRYGVPLKSLFSIVYRLVSRSFAKCFVFNSLRYTIWCMFHCLIGGKSFVFNTLGCGTLRAIYIISWVRRYESARIFR